MQIHRRRVNADDLDGGVKRAHFDRQVELAEWLVSQVKFRLELVGSELRPHRLRRTQRDMHRIRRLLVDKSSRRFVGAHDRQRHRQSVHAHRVLLLDGDDPDQDRQDERERRAGDGIGNAADHSCSLDWLEVEAGGTAAR